MISGGKAARSRPGPILIIPGIDFQRHSDGHMEEVPEGLIPNHLRSETHLTIEPPIQKTQKTQLEVPKKAGRNCDLRALSPYYKSCTDFDRAELDDPTA